MDSAKPLKFGSVDNAALVRENLDKTMNWVSKFGDHIKWHCVAEVNIAVLMQESSFRQ